MVLEAQRIYLKVFKIQLCQELPSGMGGEPSIRMVQGFGQKLAMPQASDLPQPQGTGHPHYIKMDASQTQQIQPQTLTFSPKLLLPQSSPTPLMEIPSLCLLGPNSWPHP